jgi:hypothetical protein
MQKQKITLNKDVINAIDLSPLQKYSDWKTDFAQYFNKDAGTEHYKLLAYLSLEIQSPKIIEIGTFVGNGTNALSYNEAKSVESYDIFSSFPTDAAILTVEAKSNVKCFVKDCVGELHNIVKDTDLLFIDIDHTGYTERIMMDELKKIGYKGLVLLDDTKLNEGMINFWNSITEEKLDISDYGHWSGTGIVNFDPSRFEIVVA